MKTLVGLTNLFMLFLLNLFWQCSRRDVIVPPLSIVQSGRQFSGFPEIFSEIFFGDASGRPQKLSDSGRSDFPAPQFFPTAHMFSSAAIIPGVAHEKFFSPKTGKSALRLYVRKWRMRLCFSYDPKTTGKERFQLGMQRIRNPVIGTGRRYRHEADSLDGQRRRR